MDSGWKIRLTLEWIGSQYRGSLLTYRDLPDAREETSHLFMATSREEALAVAEQATQRLGLSQYGLDDRSGEKPGKA